MTAHEPTFATYTPEHRTQCLAAFDTLVPDYFLQHERPDFEAFLTQVEANIISGAYLVARARQDVVACGGVSLAPSDASGRALSLNEAGLTWAMVRRGQHGRGLGRALLRARLAWLRQHAPHVTHALIMTSHVTAGFYERAGFRTERVIPDAFGPGFHRHDMRLALQRP